MNEDKRMFDVAIIGAGMAGLTAAIYVARAGKSVVVLEAMVSGGQIINTLKIENWPGAMGISGAELMGRVHAQALELGARFVDAKVIAIDATDSKLGNQYFTIFTDNDGLEKVDGANVLARSVIVATGTMPRKLSAKQTADAGGRAISYCATCDGALYKGKPVVVIGSGNTAKNEMRYLEGLASKVYHIHHDDPIPADAEAIFVAIGRVPNTEFITGLVDLDENGYIVAGEDCRTSLPGVFVAGDSRTKPLRQLVTAAADGAMAAINAVHYLE